MTKHLALGLLLMIAGAPVAVAGSVSPQLAPPWRQAGLSLDDPDAVKPDAPRTEVSSDPSPVPSTSCTGVSFTRNLKYGESDRNVLDVAAGEPRKPSPSPVLLLVGGESFADTGGDTDIRGPLLDQALCFAARHGLVGVTMKYRRAPANRWPTGARDVAAAISWLHQNIDLFGGSRDEIVPVGYAVGAFHIASLLGHAELQERDSNIAGAVLVSGLYAIGSDASADEKSYLGADASHYAERSAFPGILHLDIPLLLAWSSSDTPRLVTQGERLKEMLCRSPTQCPHTTVLKGGDGLASLFGTDVNGGLADPVMELIREIEVRGMP